MFSGCVNYWCALLLSCLIFLCFVTYLCCFLFYGCIVCLYVLYKYFFVLSCSFFYIVSIGLFYDIGILCWT